MAQINITLNEEQILQLLCSDRDDAFRYLLQECLNNVMKAESAEQLNAQRYERTDERTDSRNGFRERELKTRVGSMMLSVPRHRNQPFKTLVFDNYSRSEAALISSMAEMVVNGVSTRKVSRIMETLCGTSYSKSTVSEVCKELDEEVEKFRQRPLSENYPFITLDATYFKVREDHEVVSKAFMIAYGTDKHGIRDILGFSVYPEEATDTWTDFLLGLKSRGLEKVLMITSDAHKGMIRAISKVYPGVPWQRCQMHFTKNITETAPKSRRADLRKDLKQMYESTTLEEAQKVRDDIISKYKDVAEASMNCLELGFKDAMTVMTLPERYRRSFRTSNHLERLNRELKRRSDVIGIFPNESSLLRLMGAVLTERNVVLKSSIRVFSEKRYSEFEVVRPYLQLIAAEQRMMLAS